VALVRNFVVTAEPLRRSRAHAKPTTLSKSHGDRVGMFRIHEFSSATGELSSVYLRVSGAERAEGDDAERLEIVSPDGAWPLPRGALHAVLAKFGAPFDGDARISTIASLELPGGVVLRHVRHLAGYDVIGRDYIVYEEPQTEALCALAATVAAALLHLGRAGKRTV
jgi:hypothetical protein